MLRMDGSTHKRARAALSLIIVSFLPACDPGTTTIAQHITGIKGQFLITASGLNIPLSDNEYRVEYRWGDEKQTLFSGRATEDPVLLVDRAHRLLVIASCGNREIGQLAHAFEETLSSTEEQGERFRVQLINNPGFSYAGKPICVPPQAR